jgi:hypothetical protein
MSTGSSPASNDEGRLVRTARAAAALADRLTTGVAVLAGLSAGAGLLLWGLLWWPPSEALSSLFGAAGTLVLLLSPAAVLTLFYLGLRDLLALPGRLSTRTARTVEQSAETVRAATSGAPTGLLGRLWRIVKHVWALRGVLLENRALLVRTSALVRFANPGFLLLVVAATVATGLLVPGALLAVVAAWIL